MVKKEELFHTITRWLFFSGCTALVLLPSAWFLTESIQQGLVLSILVLVSGIQAWACWARPSARAYVRGIYALLCGLLVATIISTVLTPDPWRALFGGTGSIAFSALTTLMGITLFLLVGRCFVLQREAFMQTLSHVIKGVLLLGILACIGYVSGFTTTVLVGSRLLWTLLLFLALSVFVAARHRSLRESRPRFLLAITALVLTGGLFVAQMISSGQSLQEGVLPRSHAERLMKDVFFERPWTGIGPAHFGREIERVRDRALNKEPFFRLTFDQLPASGLTFIMERGILFLALMLVFLAVVSWQAWKRVRAGEAWRLVALLFALLLLALPATFVGQMLFWGLLAAASAGTHEARESERTMEALGIACSAVLLIGASYWVGSRIMGVRAAHEGDVATAARRIPWSADDQVQRLQADARALQEALTSDRSPESIRTYVANLLEETVLLTTHWPQVPATWLTRGQIYALLASSSEGADAFAIAAYQEGLRRTPHHPGFALGIADVYAARAERVPSSSALTEAKTLEGYRLEQRRLAAEWYRRALAEKPDDPLIAYRFAVEAAKAGDIATALPFMEAVWRMNPARTDRRIEYATLLALARRRFEAITLLQDIGSQDELYSASRRLLTDWYEAEERFAEALVAWKSLPSSEQATAPFRARAKALQSKVDRLR